MRFAENLNDKAMPCLKEPSSRSVRILWHASKPPDRHVEGVVSPPVLSVDRVFIKEPFYIGPPCALIVDGRPRWRRRWWIVALLSRLLAKSLVLQAQVFNLQAPALQLKAPHLL